MHGPRALLWLPRSFLHLRLITHHQSLITPMDWKLEVVIVPVSDVERAKRFYSEGVGFKVDVDHRPSERFRVSTMVNSISLRP